MAGISGPPRAKQGARLLLVYAHANGDHTLGSLLNLMGYRVKQASSGQQALKWLESMDCDLMLIDPDLQRVDGVQVMRRAREMHPNLSIIVLTSHPTLESAIAAVKLGAADYILKPFSMEDLTASISQALRERAEELRRQQLLDLIEETVGRLQQTDRPEAASSSLPAASSGRFLHAGSITLDCEKRLAVKEDIPNRRVELTKGEMAILTALMERVGEVLSCKQLARIAMGYELYKKEAESVVRPYIFRLRRKIEANPSDPQVICTVRGRGYFLSSVA